MANIRYFPRSGTTNDVGGIISTTRRKNTWRLIRIEIDNVTCVKVMIMHCYKFSKYVCIKVRLCRSVIPKVIVTPDLFPPPIIHLCIF